MLIRGEGLRLRFPRRMLHRSQEENKENPPRLMWINDVEEDLSRLGVRRCGGQGQEIRMITRRMVEEFQDVSGSGSLMEEDDDFRELSSMIPHHRFLISNIPAFLYLSLSRVWKNR